MPDFLHCIDLTDLFCSDAVNFQALKLFWQVALTPSGYMIDSTGILAMDLAGLHGCGLAALRLLLLSRKPLS